MRNLYQTRPLTEAEQELDDAIELHKEALKDEMKVVSIAILLWVVGFTMAIFSQENSRAERIGSALLLCALICFAVHFALGFRTRKYRRRAKVLVDAYLRDKALPFYQELVEMFADKPDIHLHLNDNGSITVTDKRKEPENG